MRWIIIGVGVVVLTWALWGERRADKLRYLFFLRFPILVACTLLALTPLAFLTEGRSMLRGLFDVTWAGLVWVTALAALAALPVMIACSGRPSAAWKTTKYDWQRACVSSSKSMMMFVQRCLVLGFPVSA